MYSKLETLNFDLKMVARHNSVLKRPTPVVRLMSEGLQCENSPRSYQENLPEGIRKYPGSNVKILSEVIFR